MPSRDFSVSANESFGVQMRAQRLVLVVVAVVALLGVMVAGYLAVRPAYAVYVDGETVRVSGEYEQVADVISAAGITVRPEDRVTPALTAPAEPDSAIQITRARAVTVRTETETRTVRTHQPTLAAFLAEAGIEVRRTDQISADGRAVPFSSLTDAPVPDVLEIGRFVTITIQEGQRQQTMRTAAQTVGAALQEAGITLYAADGVEPPLGNWLEPGMQIRVQRSMPLTIKVDGRLIHTRSHHRNAYDVLAEAGIGLVGQDFTRPGPETVLEADDVIEVVRVTEDFRIEDENIAYETRWQASDQLEIDTRARLQAGVPGILRRRIRIRYENGVKTGEVADAEWVAREPLDEIMGYGTKIVVRSVETPGGYYEYWRKVQMRVTSYTAASAGKAPDHPTYGITASGLKAGTGVVAVDPKVVPFRSWVYVPGYGTGFAGDTGGGVKGRWIDLGYNQGEYQSWSGYVDVYYLTPVPDPEDINYLIPTWLP